MIDEYWFDLEIATCVGAEAESSPLSECKLAIEHLPKEARVVAFEHLLQHIPPPYPSRVSEASATSNRAAFLCRTTPWIPVLFLNFSN